MKPMLWKSPVARSLLCGLALFSAVSAAQAQDAAPAAAADAAPAQGLRVVTDPAGAEVQIDRNFRGVTPLNLPGLEPGTHLVTVSLRNHRTLHKTIHLEAGVAYPLDFRMEPIVGSVLVRSEPAGVDVAMDGDHRGTTPLLLTRLALGSHRLQFTRPGYQPRTVELDIDGAAPKAVDVALVADSATVRVTTDPPGAEVYLGGARYGVSPIVMERIPAGESVLEVRADGYETAKRSLRVVAGEDAAVEVSLKELPATLKVVSIPVGARVYVNNEFRGETPLTLPGLPPASYRVRVERPDCDPVARDVALARGASVTEEFRLAANCGSIRVLTTPANVTVMVDGKVLGETKAPNDQTDQISDATTFDNIPAGERVVVFSRKGYTTVRQKVVVERNQTVALENVRLARIFIPDYTVRTKTNVFTGVFKKRTDDAITLEIRPGIERAIPMAEITEARPLRDGELETIKSGGTPKP